MRTGSPPKEEPKLPITERLFIMSVIILVIGLPTYFIFAHSHIKSCQPWQFDKVVKYAQDPKFKDYIAEIYSDDFISIREYECLEIKVELQKELDRKEALAKNLLGE